jgi:P-type Cu+ transporter
MNEKNEKTTLFLKGLHCAACVNRVEKRLKKFDGVTSVSVNLATQKANVEFDSAKVTQKDFKEAIEDEGYTVVEIEDKKKTRP